MSDPRRFTIFLAGDGFEFYRREDGDIGVFLPDAGGETSIPAADWAALCRAVAPVARSSHALAAALQLQMPLGPSEVAYHERPLACGPVTLEPGAHGHLAFTAQEPLTARLGFVLVRSTSPACTAIWTARHGASLCGDWNGIPLDSFHQAPDRPGFYVLPFWPNRTPEGFLCGQRFELTVQSLNPPGVRPAITVECVLPMMPPGGPVGA